MIPSRRRRTWRWRMPSRLWCRRFFRRVPRQEAPRTVPLESSVAARLIRKFFSIPNFAFCMVILLWMLLCVIFINLPLDNPLLALTMLTSLLPAQRKVDQLRRLDRTRKVLQLAATRIKRKRRMVNACFFKLFGTSLWMQTSSRNCTHSQCGAWFNFLKPFCLVVRFW